MLFTLLLAPGVRRLESWHLNRLVATLIVAVLALALVGGVGWVTGSEFVNLAGNSGKAQITDGLKSGQRVATTGAFELFKLEPDVLSKVKVQIAPAKEDEEPEET